VSQSPLEAATTSTDAYATSWSALNKLLRRGYSWSGREANCAFLNLGGGRFANISAASGFDFVDDARATALCDWDGDGDLDVWSTNRTGPRVRFLRNDQASGNGHVTLMLVGTRSNRDAIGARAELELALTGGERRTLVRGVRAGEGYLAQSSSRLTIGLPKGARLERVRVVWPGGTREEFRGVQPGAAWRLVEGSAQAERLDLVQSAGLAVGSTAAPAASLAARVVLVRPVPLPRLELVADDGKALALFGLGANGEPTGTGKALLLNLFASTCAPCAGELADFARHRDELARSGIAVLALATEPLEERARAGAFLAQLGWPFPWAAATPATLEFLDALQSVLLDREQRLPLPTSFLVDAEGALRVLYFGPLTAERLVADKALLELGEGALFDAAAPFPGRWMFPALPADADFLEPRLRARGLEDAAREYARARIAVVKSSPVELLQDFARRAAIDGRLPEAEAYFRRAHGLDPRHFGVLFDWAVVAHRQEKLAEASELYAKCLTLKPEDVDTRFNLALAQLGLGRRKEAERQLRWLEPRAPEVARTLAAALESTPDGK
jgi:tetratricopeptide (TPR) repeat protein